MKPASQSALNLFRSGTTDREVPIENVNQITDCCSTLDGVPCLNSLDIHRCDDVILFERWDHKELWLRQRELCTLRWSSLKERFFIGDAGNVRFPESDEYRSFIEALRHLVKLNDSSEGA